jgi:hypothetical protein
MSEILQYWPVAAIIGIVLVGLILLPDLEVDEDGEEIFGDSPPKVKKCSIHKWAFKDGKSKCTICGFVAGRADDKK